MTPPHLRSDRTFIIDVHHRQYGSRGRLLKTRRKVPTEVRPVNGETHFNDVGLSQGFIHFAHPKTGERLGFCGVNYFDENAIEVV